LVMVWRSSRLGGASCSVMATMCVTPCDLSLHIDRREDEPPERRGDAQRDQRGDPKLDHHAA
jgi:hypothetical protein